MRQLILLSVVLLGASWVAAQNYPSQTTKSSSGSEATIQGCLSGSAGNYTLTDKNGMNWQLTGDTAKLKEHVGHEVKITGTEGSASESASGRSASNMGGTEEPKSIHVTSVKHVSKTCTSGGGAH